jgi:hypothetical protein
MNLCGVGSREKADRPRYFKFLDGP